MPELKLAANLTGWRLFIRRRSDKAFEPLAKRIYDRDQYTCQYCGFQAQEFQEIVNIDGNYLNNKSSNMITACCFCTQGLFLQAVGIDEMGGGQIIYLPEINQADLNSFCHVLFVAMGNTTGFQEGAQTIYRSLRFRSQIIENKFGQGTSNPAVFGQLLVEYQDAHPGESLDSLLQDIRLLPSYTKFKTQLDAWAQAALKELEQNG
jgi:intracellular multiplication protein IcmJ